MELLYTSAMKISCVVNGQRNFRSKLVAFSAWLCTLTLIAASSAQEPTIKTVEGSDDQYFNQAVAITPKILAVIAEGEGEPLSTGSYSVRLYHLLNNGFERDNYYAGTIEARDGHIQQVHYGQGILEGKALALAVIIESVGTGGYRTAHVFRVDEKRLLLQKTLDDSTIEKDKLAQKIFGTVWSPQPGVLCDQYICASAHEGVSFDLTKEYLGEGKAGKLAAIEDGSIDKKSFTFSNHVSCDTLQRTCVNKNSFDAKTGQKIVNAKYTRLLFGGKNIK